MAKLHVPATKSQLFRLKGQQQIAQDGFELLEQKREILVMELMRMLERVKLLERELDEQVEKAYASLKRMLLAVGRARSAEISSNVKFGFVVHERVQRIAGVTLPSLDVQIPDLEPKYSFMDTYSHCDRTMVEFFELLKLVGQMAGIRTVVWRLAKEVKKTQRRVNALEKQVIPDTRETVAYIQSVLEEREREALFIQKQVKSRLGG
ncbi:MAG TPA: V-type ATP synthase subunit D [Spirochaetia bacterium]|nr:V-type ATP synthase subunit D [Spirochaetia bacterium]